MGSMLAALVAKTPGTISKVIDLIKLDNSLTVGYPVSRYGSWYIATRSEGDSPRNMVLCTNY